MQKTTWDDFRQQCMRIDPYLSVEYSTEIYDAWISGDTPEGAVSRARKIYNEFEEWATIGKKKETKWESI